MFLWSITYATIVKQKNALRRIQIREICFKNPIGDVLCSDCPCQNVCFVRTMYRTSRAHSSSNHSSYNILPNYFHVVLKQLKYLFIVAVCWYIQHTDKVGSTYTETIYASPNMVEKGGVAEYKYIVRTLFYICIYKHILCVPGRIALHFSILWWLYFYYFCCIFVELYKQPTTCMNAINSSLHACTLRMKLYVENRYI